MPALCNIANTVAEGSRVVTTFDYTLQEGACRTSGQHQGIDTARRHGPYTRTPQCANRLHSEDFKLF